MLEIKKKYLEMIDSGFNLILEKLEPYSNNIIENEGSINLSISKIGEYLFNRQPSSLQLWGSSPLTGPSRFRMEEKEWIHEKKNIPLKKYLELEVSDICQKRN
ncbi:frataxin [Vairimorpha necatrix]|uniref:Frataxin n=1 Tax=Vairimorpha necatrix TaxID=6039 RepID=A0AAX4J9W8_9MICR